MVDPLLDTILEVLGDTNLGMLQVVRVVSGARSTMGFFDDGTELAQDGSGRRVQVTDRVVRIREDSIPRPAQDSTITLEFAEEDGDGVVTRTRGAYRVRYVEQDPGQAGMWRMPVGPE